MYLLNGEGIRKGNGKIAKKYFFLKKAKK